MIFKSRHRNSKTFFADDIYTCLNDAANQSKKLPPGLTLNNIAASWINRDRLPLVTVTRDYDSGNITFNQVSSLDIRSRFFLFISSSFQIMFQQVYLRDRPQESAERSKYSWFIPIVMVPQSSLNFSKTEPILWMTKDGDRNVTVKDIVPKDNFVIVNPEEIGKKKSKRIDTAVDLIYFSQECSR